MRGDANQNKRRKLKITIEGVYSGEYVKQIFFDWLRVGVEQAFRDGWRIDILDDASSNVDGGGGGKDAMSKMRRVGGKGEVVR